MCATPWLYTTRILTLVLSNQRATVTVTERGLTITVEEARTLLGAFRSHTLTEPS